MLLEIILLMLIVMRTHTVDSVNVDEDSDEHGDDDDNDDVAEEEDDGDDDWC